jgi:hypothetical protein
MTKKSTSQAWVTVVLVTLTACDPEVRIEGNVLNADGQSLDKAEALVQCPGLCVYGLSDAKGILSGSDIGLCPADCIITIRAAGYRPFSEKIAKHCVAQSRGMCSAIRVEARLQPLAPRKQTASADGKSASTKRFVPFDGGTALVQAEGNSDHVTVVAPDGGLRRESWCAAPANYDLVVNLFSKFRSALLAKDEAAVADLVRFPLRVNGRPAIAVPNRENLLSHFYEVFNPSTVNKINRAEPSAVFCRNGTEAMLGDGVLWARGDGSKLLVDVVNR